MSVRVVKVPDVGEGIAEVELVAWHVKPGDTLAEDQALADVMTDKATVEIPSPVAGRALSLGGALGTTIAVGAELIRIEVEGTAGETIPPPAAKAPPPAKAAAAAPAAPAVAVTKPAPPPEPPSRAAPPIADRPIASPSVRRRAWELGIDLREVRATGTAGRITQADLEAYAKAHPAQQTRPVPAAPGAPHAGTQSIPVVGLRRQIALKMQDAMRRIPHFTYVEEVDVTELETLREILNRKWGDRRGRLTLLPFLMRAIVLSVHEHPQINARFDDNTGTLLRFDAVHIGIAMQTEVGLMVPVVRNAETLDLWDSAAEIARLAGRARGGGITRDEMSGSTITVTSLGALGGIVTTPIINYPEVAIVGVNRVVERPVIRGGAVVPRKMMNLSSSFDHRVVDGKHAAEFVQSLRSSLECPGTLFIE